MQALADGPVPPPDDVDDSDDPAEWPLVLSPDRDITAADVRRIYAYDAGRFAPTHLAPETVLARKNALYTCFHARDEGPLVVSGEDGCHFRLEWWQIQDHLPRHRLARRADEHRREMYEPPDPCWGEF